MPDGANGWPERVDPESADAHAIGVIGGRAGQMGGPMDSSGPIIETVVSPFHCLYQDALDFHTQSRLRLASSEPESSRLARAALLLYVSSAEALVHQAAVELGRGELTGILTDPDRPLSVSQVWTLLPALVGSPAATGFDPENPPWPQFAELMSLRDAWLYPGGAASRRVYYRAPRAGAAFEPLQPHQIPAGLRLGAEDLIYPRTGLPRDLYALRPVHLDTVRGILDAAIGALDRRLGGALTRDGRHRLEPVRVVHPRNGMG